MRASLRLLLLGSLVPTLFAAEPELKVVFADKILTFTAAEFAALPRMEVTVTHPHEQKEHRFSGVAASELLLRAGAPLGAKLRGAALQLAVSVRSRDGYGVVFALADFDDAFSSRTIILADQEDGHALPANAAPFRLITPGDKKPARWARMVNSIEITTAGVPAAPAK